MAPQTVQPHANRGKLTGSERGRLSAMALVVLGLNLGGWGIFAFAIAPHHFQFKGLGLGLGLGVVLTAWTLGRPARLRRRPTSPRSTTPPAS